DPGRRPLSSDTALFLKPSLYMDGTDDFLQSTFLNYPSGSFFIFHNPLNKNSTLISQARFTFSGFNFYLNNSQRPSVNCLATPAGTGFTFNGYAIPDTIPSHRVGVEGIVLQPSGARIFTGMSDSVSQQSVAYLDLPTLTPFRVGAMGNNSGYYKGHLYELFIADTSLTRAQYDMLYNYVTWKYQPPVNLGPDIHKTYGFCPLTLSATTVYSAYIWSTGDTVPAIQVKNPGTYWLQTTDFFGRISRDTILITNSVPGLSLSDTIICLNTQAHLQSGFTGAYQYLWDNDTLLNQPSLLTGTPGLHILVVKDSFNCTISDTALVSLDLYASTISLGPDKSVCSGEPLALVSGAPQTVTYQWNTGINDTLPQIIISSSGTYLVTTTNPRGCVATSQVNVWVKGASPQALFLKSAVQVCTGDTLHCTDASVPALPAFPVTKWQWDFGNGMTDTVQNPDVVYSQPGIYYITFTATTDSGCFATYSDSVLVFALPIPWITTGTRCSARPVQLNANAIGGTVTAYLWTIENGSATPDTSSLSNPLYSWIVAGNYWVKLEVTNQNACTNSDSLLVEIHQTPFAAFNYTPALLCTGSEVELTDKSLAGTLYPNNFWRWNFGDGSSQVTGLPNPSHTYLSHGLFPVSLLVGSSVTGCYDSVVVNVDVGANPIAIITDTTFCAGQARNLAEASTTISDTLVSWQWISPVFGTLSGKSPAIVCPDTGSFPLMLIVETQRGCRDTASSSLVSYPTPIAGFSMTPLYGNAPLLVQFTNKTVNGDIYLWDFGDGYTSGLLHPAHTFDSAGIFDVSLLATSSKGCFNSHSDKVFTIKTAFDIEVTGVQALMDQDRIQISADIRNNAAFPVHRIDLQCWINSQNPVVEIWQAQGVNDRLQPGHTFRYQFVSRPILPKNPDQSPYAVCVNVSVPEYPTDDNTANDRGCVAITDAFHISQPYPNPASGTVWLDAVLEFSDQLTIELYNLNGQKLNTLFDQPVEKGFSRITLHLPANLPGGVALLKISYRDYTGVRKIITVE
ncbi:MAG TPA: PKD domain-containing protein, partial [Bacteroidales bacterium]|nr:PKD domain-containing protein [Bacteroidales bacterium]